MNDSLIDIDFEVLQPDEEGMRRRRRPSTSDFDIKSKEVIMLASGIQPQSRRQTIQKLFGRNSAKSTWHPACKQCYCRRLSHRNARKQRLDFIACMN